jgi:hypothetical protein
MDLINAPVSRNHPGKYSRKFLLDTSAGIFPKNYFGVPGAGSDPGKDQRRKMYSSHHDELYFWFFKEMRCKIGFYNEKMEWDHDKNRRRQCYLNNKENQD